MMEKKIVDYKTVCGSQSEHFDRKIANLLAKDWKLYKAPYGLSEADECYFCQAMVKYENDIVEDENKPF